MTISESQLQTWSNGGATTAAQTTHTSIRNAINESQRMEGKNFDTFLQGSYRNSTNVRADSDVDLVVRLNSAFMYDVSDLTESEQTLFETQHRRATYDWSAFRTDVLATLQDYYGAQAVTEGKKAIKVESGPSRLAADVVVALEYRDYQRYEGLESEDYIEGISFTDRSSGHLVVNFPAQHYDNGVSKNTVARTDARFKPTVRMFKNARGCLVEDGILRADLAPSYYIQCLLYNVPDEEFFGTFQDAYCNIVNWLQKASLDTFVCQNGLVSLFGSAPEQWNISSAKTFISALIKLWNEW